MKSSKLVFALSLALAASAYAQDDTLSEQQQPGAAPTGSAEQAQTPLTPTQWTNEMALNQLHHINQKEVEMAKMAQEKAQSPQVKSSAQQILKDHQALDSRVESVAKSQNFTLQDFQPSTYEKAAMDRLDKLSGAQFDQAFTQNMRMGHEMAAQQLRMTRSEVKDSQIRSLIDTAMPKIQQHAKTSKSMESKMKEQAGRASDQS